MKENNNIKSYTLKLLKKKNYYIIELYEKLKKKYEVEEVNRIIKECILLEILNDKLLVEMKTYYLLYVKKYGKKYIINYFINKHISYNLILHILAKYNDDLFLNNMNQLIKELKIKNKSNIFIYNYLLRKGYEEEDIKKYVS